MKFGNDMITFEEAVAYLKDMPRFTVKKNPADSRDLKWFLKKLGNPEKDLRIIHVAGTTTPLLLLSVSQILECAPGDYWQNSLSHRQTSLPVSDRI